MCFSNAIVGAHKSYVSPHVPLLCFTRLEWTMFELALIGRKDWAAAHW